MLNKLERRIVRSVKDFNDPWHRTKAYNPVGRRFEWDTSFGEPGNVQNGGVYDSGAPSNADVLEWFHRYVNKKKSRKRMILKAMSL